MEATYHHVYQDQLDNESFRLLRVTLGTADSATDPILKCELTAHSLSDCPPYLALSYAWIEPQAIRDGDEEIAPSVSLNEQQVSIKPNLSNALHHLARHETDDDLHHYWIDALCIDQSVDSERTSQVSIMHRIYRNASKVLVWLGPDFHNEVYTVREFFRALLQKYYHEDYFRSRDGESEEDWKHSRRYKYQFLHTDDEHALAAEGLPPLDHGMWMAVVRFWNRSWFNRVWVQQEVAVAKNLEIRCGGVKFSPKEVIETSRFHVMSGLGETLMLLKSKDRTRAIVGPQVGCSAVRIEELQRWMIDISTGEAADFQQAANRLVGLPHMTEGKHPLLRTFAVCLFLNFRDGASDPRDRVFALLVLMKQIAHSNDLPELPLRVDYAKSTSEVYRETTAWVIEESGCLGILCLLHPARNLAMNPVMNSWVPDYRSLPPRPLLMFSRRIADHIRDRYGMITPPTEPKFHHGQLMVTVKRIGRVADIGDTYETMIDDGLYEESARILLNCPATRKGKSRLDLWIDILSDDSNSSLDRSDQRAAFKHLLSFFVLRRIRNDYMEGRISRGRDHLEKMPSFEELAKLDETMTLPDYLYWYNTLRCPERTGEILNHRPRFGTVEIQGRRLFRTSEDSLLGIGPEIMKPGDEVFAVFGCVLPLVLRRLDGSATCSPEHSPRIVIGEAYLSEFDEILEYLDDKDTQTLQIQ